MLEEPKSIVFEDQACASIKNRAFIGCDGAMGQGASLPATGADLSGWTRAETRHEARNSNGALCLTVGSVLG